MSGLCALERGIERGRRGKGGRVWLLTIYSLVTRLNIIWQRIASLRFKAAIPCHSLFPPPSASFLFRVACFDGLQLLMHIHAKRLLHKRTAQRLSPPLALALGWSSEAGVGVRVAAGVACYEGGRGDSASKKLLSSRCHQFASSKSQAAYANGR